MDTYIERLSLKNVGKFDSLNVIFNPRVNVIIGANGTGKTSILRGICNCMSPSMLENVRNRQGASYNLYCSLNGKKYLIGADDVVNTDQEYHKLNIEQWNLHSEEGYERVFMHQTQNYHLLSIGAYRFLPISRCKECNEKRHLWNDRINISRTTLSILTVQQCPISNSG